MTDLLPEIHAPIDDPPIDDPEWVLARYREARSLLDEIQTNVRLPMGFRDEVQDFLDQTFFDTCTTLGNDCACNRRTKNG